MLQEMPKYTYVAENYAVVTWGGERVFDLLQGKATWVVSCNGVRTEFGSFHDAEEFFTSIVGDAEMFITYWSRWYVIADAAFHTFESEWRAKEFIEKLLRVREIIRGRIQNRAPAPL